MNNQPTLRDLAPHLGPVDTHVVLRRAKKVRARRRAVAGTAAATVVVVALAVSFSLQNRPDAVPAETPSSTTTASWTAGCPSHRPRTAPPGMQPASAPGFYWAGVAYIPAYVQATKGTARFQVKCKVFDAPEGKEWITPFPDGAARGFAVGTIVYRAAGHDDDCLLVAQPDTGGELMAFKPSEPVPGC